MISRSRRGFLRAAAGLTGASLCHWPMLSAAAERGKDSAPGRAGGFILGLQSYSLRGYGVDDAIQHAHELGVGSMEFFSGHYALDSSADEIERMTSKLKALGIQPLGHGVNGFSKDHEANRRVFEFARKAGIRNISADPSEDAFDSLDKLVEEYQIRIAIHNHGPGARYDKVADVLTAIQGRHKLIGACADLGHYIRSAEDPVKVINLLEGRLFGIHLKDFAQPRGDAPGTILGKGQLDVVGVFKALKKVEFPADGALSLEYEEHPDNPLADIGECLEIAREAAEKAVA